MSPTSVMQYFGGIRNRFGTGAAVHELLRKLVNKLAYVECFHIVALERERLQRPAADAHGRFSSFVATRAQLESMREQPQWRINDVLMRNHAAGDACIVSCVDGAAAGYTWVHADGHPELLPGLAISVPHGWIYNYAGLTLPEFRGAGLQAWRHHAVLGDPRWSDCLGMIGYVRAANFESRHGQAKSGYRRVGSIWLIGRRSERYWAFVSPSLRRRGIRRIVLPAAQG